jgi:hypothetical protein
MLIHTKFLLSPKRATREFNSSPVLGEVPQAEGYECYNAAALGLASAWRAVPFMSLGHN